MGIVVDIIAEVAKLVLWLPFEIVMVATGEVVLWALTGGRRKPRWDLYTSDRPAKFVVFYELSCWVGMASWLIVIVAMRRYLSGGSDAV